jgi:hypothetical protein
VALIGEPEVCRDFRERQIGSCQQALCAFDPPLHDVLMRRHPHGSLELPMEMKRAEGHGGGELLEREGLIEVFLDQIEDLPQPAGRQAASGERWSPLHGGVEVAGRELSGVHIALLSRPVPRP